MGSSSRSVSSLQLCLLTILSAFLLFQVQPVISKFILPWFGGSPGVWTTCMLFFQVVLFAGYAYAHALTRLPRRWQGLIHAVFVLAAAVSLPISPGSEWKPSGEDDPTRSILMLLLANVALPYFVLSSTSPLVQVWFSRGSDGRAPWRLYALSNLGSLAALLSYPFFFEPRWDVMQQTWMWSGAFVAFAMLSLLSAYADWQNMAPAAVEGHPAESAPSLPPPRPKWWQQLLWLVLPAVASVLLLASTNHLCQDVAVIPFLWVVPLSLYLLTFIICFEHERWYVRWIWALTAMILLFAAAVPADFAVILSKVVSIMTFKETSIDITPNFRWEIALVAGAMFVGCMVCHGELARLKPHPSHLTAFYLMMSAGGALGGLFVSQAAPRLFTTYVEWPGVLLATFGIATFCFVLSSWQTRSLVARVVLVAFALLPAGIGIADIFKPDPAAAFIGGPLQEHPSLRYLLAGVFVIGSVGVLCVICQQRNRWSRRISACSAAYLTGVGVWWIATHAFEKEDRLEIVRNFYGVISVQDEYDDAGEGWRTLYHGSILHGRQFLSDAWDHEPLSYYGHETGVGVALLTVNDRPDTRVGVVGMGAGTVASYGQKGHTYRFYDINPEIVRLARTRFRYLEGMEARGGKIEVALGDARLSLENEGPQKFDVLLLDAFSGDSVPVHLLTQEAFAIYLRHMKPDGIIAVHVSNRYLALAPMIQRVAQSLGVNSTRIITELDGFDEATDYVMVTNNAAFLSSHPPEVPSTPEPPATLWTDRRHNLFECLIVTDD